MNRSAEKIKEPSGEKPRKKNRLDLELVNRGLAPSRETAQAMIMAGEIRVDGQLADKAATCILEENEITIQTRALYASRGALKIEKAVKDFALDVRAMQIMDVGISNGGFSDFLLQNGAAGVTGVDVTISQVNERLQKDPRVRLIEKNARYLEPRDIETTPDLIVVDLSFISVLKVLPALRPFNAPILLLVKPQFEAPKGRVGKKGVVRGDAQRIEILVQVKRDIEMLNFRICDLTPAGITGKKGNQEYFLLLDKGAERSMEDTDFINKLECRI